MSSIQGIIQRTRQSLSKYCQDDCLAQDASEAGKAEDGVSIRESILEVQQ